MSPEQEKALALARARRRRAEAQSGDATWRNDGQTGVVEQATSGFNEGVADLLGSPVDLVTSGINGVLGGVNYVTGSEIQPITDPVGGSQSFRSLMAPTITEDQPQTAPQRYGRSVAHDIGMSVPSAALLGRANSVVEGAKAVAPSVTSAFGSGVGSQVARDVAPNSALAEVAGSLIGGGLPIAGNALAHRMQSQFPSLDDLRTQRDAAYDMVDNSGSTVTPEGRQALVDALDQRMASERMHPRQHPRSTAAMEGVHDNLPAAPTIRDIEQERQIISRDVAGQFNEPDGRLGQAAKEEIDAFLNSLDETSMTGGDPQATLNALRQGRELHGRIKKAEELGFQQYKAENRASSTGQGGNAVNAMRQNIRQILDNPKRSARYSPNEIAMMEQIVRGDRVDNALRRVAGFSPTRGWIPALSSTASGLAGVATGNPLALGLFGLSGVGMAAQAAGEGRTAGQINRLIGAVQNGAPIPANALSLSDRSALATLALRAAMGQQE